MILCLGTTPVYQRTMVFDRVAIDAVNRATQVYDYASGKSINAARVIHAMEHDVLATGFVGGGRGESIRRDLDAAGVRHDFVTVVPETRQCITVIDHAAGTATELVEESSPVGETAWNELEAKLQGLLPLAEVWVFSGTLAPDAAKDFCARHLPLARQCGARAIVDVSGEPLRLAMSHRNAILKMNRDELAASIGEDLGDERALSRAMLRHAPPEGYVIVTLGAAGAMASDGRHCWRASSPKIAAVSAVGSGDAFAGGLAVALAQNVALPDALKLAVACGAANALTSLAGHLDRAMAKRFASNVPVVQLEIGSSPAGS